MHLDVMTYGGSLGQIQELTKQAEDAGFDGLWLTEGGRSVFNGATAASLAARGLTIGTGIAVAFARSPMVTAQAAWELQQETEGRFVLGLGSQVRAHVERRYSATFEHPGARLAEYVAAVKQIFNAFRGTSPLDFAGDFYRFSLLPPEWSPGPIDYPDPPVCVAAVNPWMIRMAGTSADGIHVHPLNGTPYLNDVVRPALDQGARKSGRALRDLTVVCPVMTAVSDDAEALARQREDIRFRLAFYGSTPNYEVVLASHGWPGVTAKLHEQQRARDYAAMAATITDEMLDALAITSSWRDLAPALIDRYQGIADRVVCYSATPQWGDPWLLERWAGVAADFRAATD